MSYKSIDTLQEALSLSMFKHTKDARKAAGRSLGTMVEIITFYFLRQWGVLDNISIERALPEYGNPEITHNVEFTLHPILDKATLTVSLPITVKKIAKCLDDYWVENMTLKSNVLLDTKGVLRNACQIAESERKLLVANLLDLDENSNTAAIDVCMQSSHAYSMFECKRVGVEKGNKKGPQTIEKAKQGVYVALTSSSLQKVWNENGVKLGLIYQNGEPIMKPYEELLDDLIDRDELTDNFILSVGVVSNHGNWFTSDNQNKELKVLSESYDWLLFLTDDGFSKFITDLLLKPEAEYAAVKKAFEASYNDGKKMNVFTKTKIDYSAHLALCQYFKKNIKDIEGWFNVIAPCNYDISKLHDILLNLSKKQL